MGFAHHPKARKPWQYRNLGLVNSRPKPNNSQFATHYAILPENLIYFPRLERQDIAKDRQCLARTVVLTYQVSR
jgi:hypothetical protein